MIYQSISNQYNYAVQITDNNGLVKLFELYSYGTTFKHKKQKRRRMNFPRISFSKLDYILRERFYQLAFPVVRSRLRICSKELSKFGEKPLNFSLTSYVERISKVDLSGYKKITANFVVKFQDSAKFIDFSAGDFYIFRKFCDFDLEEIRIENSEIANYELKLLFTPKITSFYTSQDTKFDIYAAISLTPNIQQFGVYKKLENGWEKEFSNLKLPKLKICYISVGSFNDPKSFHSFLEQHNFRPFVEFIDNRIKDVTIDDNFLKYFKPMERLSGSDLSFVGRQFRAERNHLKMFANTIISLLFFVVELIYYSFSQIHLW